MAKVLQTLRTNWKKSIFFSGVAVYGVRYANRKYEEKQLMRHYSKIAIEYGQKTIPIAAQKSYHVTVILNPAAHSGAARTRFEKFCSPLLHLAGMKVSVIRTTHSGNAQEIMNVMDDTDAVLIAGGDGTIFETVTGLLRREDANKLVKELPIGILPVGIKNQMAHNLFPDSKDEVVLMAESAISVIKKFLRPVDVMKIKSDVESVKDKPLYFLREFKVGAFTDAQERRDKYWYWPGLKKYMTYIFSYTTAASKIMWSLPSQINLGLVNEKSGREEDDFKNNKHKEDLTEKLPEIQPNNRSSWWSYIVPPSRSNSNSRETSNSHYSQDENHLKWLDDKDKISYSGCELTVESNNNFPLNKDGEKFDHLLRMSLGPDQLAFTDFVREGWRRESQPANDLHVPNDWFHSFANAIQWDPNSSLINSADLTENNENNNNTDLTEKSFYLDSEAVDIRGPMEISVLPEKIILFCGESVARTLTKSDSGTSTSNNRKWWQRTTTANSLVSVKTTNKF